MHLSKEEFNSLQVGDSIEVFYVENGYIIRSDSRLNYPTLLATVAKIGEEFIFFFWKKEDYPVKGAKIQGNLLQQDIDDLYAKNLLTGDIESFNCDGISHEGFCKKIVQRFCQQEKEIELQCIDKHCGTWVRWAEANLPQGKFMCYRCRYSTPWKFEKLQNELK